ncbi:MAG TPA: AAA family ATPase [Polyangiaceae bacterium]|jgi:hypothetical protein
MSLESLHLLPRGDSGWTSGALAFGRTTTLVLGPNGAGKTPIIEALTYGLGHPVELPPLVRKKCSAVVVVLRTETGPYRIERHLGPGLEVNVTEPSGASTRFENERSFSEWVLPMLGVSLRSLSGTGGDKVPPYVSVVGPMFFVDQDTGWSTSYMPFESHRFVKDQREEVVRWLLDIPAKHRPIDKSEFQSAKTTLAGIQEQIAFKRNGLEALQRELGEDRAPSARERLESRRSTLEAELLRGHSILESASQAESAFDVRVRDAVQRRDQSAFTLANAKRRKAQLVEVQSEVSAELGALEQNEIAAEAFRNLCGSESCQFFRKPEESYGRRVLYLKDQLKDFEFSTGETERDLDSLQAQCSAAEAELQEALELKKKSLEGTEGGAAIVATQTISRELADVRVRIDRLERIGRAHDQLDALINKEQRAAEEVAEHRPTTGPRRETARLLDARQTLARTFKEWLLALRTPNVPADVVFDEELRLIVSGERFSSRSSHSGSTRTRLVLAYHAALLETSILMAGVHPRLLVLDAPRQHELSARDLRAFVERFYTMFSKEERPVQLVFSATDREVVPKGRVDELWEPGFEIERQPRFLGPPPRAPLELTVAAHFHSGQEQIMMVLDHGEVARLAKLLPELGAAIASGRTWSGKTVTVRWSGGRYETKLVHHIDNGNVKFTVRKGEARRLWDYLDELLRGSDPARDFAARYTLGTEDVLDEFFVKVVLPGEGPKE